MRKFMSIRSCAQLPDCPVSVGFIKRLVQRGECPGIQNGKRFLVNPDALFEMLQQQSLEGVKKDAVSD